MMSLHRHVEKHTRIMRHRSNRSQVTKCDPQSASSLYDTQSYNQLQFPHGPCITLFTATGSTLCRNQITQFGHATEGQSFYSRTVFSGYHWLYDCYKTTLRDVVCYKLQQLWLPVDFSQTGVIIGHRLSHNERIMCVNENDNATNG